ncbi:MAG: type II toxin-antitoxin system VapC family toxin [Chloroflexi bacterium]|nr:type II toxin-antitoxin system VapC family toxin [Chloroflexota bacterium]
MSVIDASVALKWVLAEEELAEEAAHLFAATLQERQPIVAPPHFPAEVCDAIYQRQRRGLLSAELAGEAVNAFLAFAIPTLAPRGLYRQAFDFACTYTLPSLYDSLYVVLAHLLQTTLWTADQRLVNALAGRLDFVRWLGDYPG